MKLKAFVIVSSPVDDEVIVTLYVPAGTEVKFCDVEPFDHVN
jgi:hypothetical protein